MLVDMSDETLATEATKNAIENAVNGFLADRLEDPAITIAMKKFMTNDNVLIYLTHCNVAELSVPRIKVQVLRRVTGGVEETGYQIFSDHRFTKFVNKMMFGTKPEASPHYATEDVSEVEAGELLELVNDLTQARQTL